MFSSQSDADAVFRTRNALLDHNVNLLAALVVFSALPLDLVYKAIMVCVCLLYTSPSPRD